MKKLRAMEGCPVHEDPEFGLEFFRLRPRLSRAQPHIQDANNTEKSALGIKCS